MLTDNQIALMTKKKKRVNWTCDEIAKGFTLSFFNRRGYDYLIHSLQYPLPSLRTLQIWSSNMSLVPGKILTDSFIVLKALSETLSNGERQVVVAFDEMKCKSLNMNMIKRWIKFLALTSKCNV
ncbi:hypothetical protein HA402_005635 [Bradysia odoriphaga]|nr:hypothetical protein HA402_005635 [Bradysia odoriphaga]